MRLALKEKKYPRGTVMVNNICSQTHEASQNRYLLEELQWPQCWVNSVYQTMYDMHTKMQM